MAKAETRIVEKVRRALVEAYKGIYVRKIHGNPYQHSGIPDLVGCVHRLFFGLEVKTEDGKPSTIQLLEGRAIEDSGGIFAVVRSPEEAVQVLDRRLGIRRPKIPCSDCENGICVMNCSRRIK